ncbi:MAG: hypothetical protein LBK68_02975 [Candidatus Margulisbacteria bacterium]|jgi:hypothetical protein|nr:hypothetical protein [Candidatus Margulisiibacteriota bacterium]
MANNYTDKFEGTPYFIKKGEQLSAAGMTAALNTKENVANKKDTVNNDSTEYPSSKAVYDKLSTLSFFPRGTILPFSSTAWDEASADFKKIWKICDGQNGVINLVGRFIRGGAYANYGATGGTDVAQVPKHSHTFKGNNSSGSIQNFNESFRNPTGVFSVGSGWCNTVNNGNAERGCVLLFSMTPTGAISEEGVASADNRPAFTTLIFIQKVG